MLAKWQSTYRPQATGRLQLKDSLDYTAPTSPTYRRGPSLYYRRHGHAQKPLCRSNTVPVDRANNESSPDPAEAKNSIFIWGLGYTGEALARLLHIKSWRVAGTCRSSDKQRELQQQGYQAFLFDTDHLSLGLGKAGIAALQSASHVLVTISPSSAGEEDPVMWILGREFKRVSQNLQWIGYLSSTSVYGDWQGEWVTEDSEPRASAGNGAQRLLAETAWRRFYAATGLPLHIFRLAGIYGPGRSALDAALKGGESKRSGKQYTSRVHVLDLCRVLIASMENPNPGAIYNIADDDPASREEVLDYVRSNLLVGSPAGCAGEGLQPASQKPKAARLKEEKRVSNAKMKSELNVELEFASYKEGLQAIKSGDFAPFDCHSKSN